MATHLTRWFRTRIAFCMGAENGWYALLLALVLGWAASRDACADEEQPPEGLRLRWAVLTQADWERAPRIQRQGFLAIPTPPDSVLEWRDLIFASDIIRGSRLSADSDRCTSTSTETDVPLPSLAVPRPYSPLPVDLRLHLPCLVPRHDAKRGGMRGPYDTEAFAQPSRRHLTLALVRTRVRRLHRAQVETILQLSALPTLPELSPHVPGEEVRSVERLCERGELLRAAAGWMTGLQLGHSPIRHGVPVIARVEVDDGKTDDLTLEDWRGAFRGHAERLAEGPESISHLPTPLGVSANNSAETLALTLASPSHSAVIRALRSLFEGSHGNSAAEEYLPWVEASLFAGDETALAPLERIQAKLTDEGGSRNSEADSHYTRFWRQQMLESWTRIAVRTGNQGVRDLALSELADAALPDLVPVWMAVQNGQVEAPPWLASLIRADSDVRAEHLRAKIWILGALAFLLVLAVLLLRRRARARRIGGTALALVGLALASMRLRLGDTLVQLEWAGYAYLVAGGLLLLPYARTRLARWIPIVVLFALVLGVFAEATEGPDTLLVISGALVALALSVLPILSPPATRGETGLGPNLRTMAIGLATFFLPITLLAAWSDGDRLLQGQDFNVAQALWLLAAVSLFVLAFRLVLGAWAGQSRRSPHTQVAP